MCVGVVSCVLGVSLGVWWFVWCGVARRCKGTHTHTVKRFNFLLIPNPQHFQNHIRALFVLALDPVSSKAGQRLHPQWVVLAVHPILSVARAAHGDRRPAHGTHDNGRDARRRRPRGVATLEPEVANGPDELGALRV